MKTFKLILLITLFLVLPKVSEAFACLGAAGGGNWNAAGTWTNCNSTTPQTGDSVLLDATSGNVAVNVSSAALLAFDMTGYTGTLSGTSAVTVAGSAGTTQEIKFDGTITWTGTLALNPTATGILNLTTNGKLLTALTVGGSSGGQIILQDNLSFTAVKTATLNINVSGSALDLNGFTISGNSATNRLLVNSLTLGTQRDIDRNGGAFANADFRDINLEAAYDCSAITGLCGDAGGNSADFTFTTAQTQTNSGTASFTWSTASNWTGSTPQRVPLPQDDVVIDGVFTSGRIVTMDMPRLGHSIDASGATWSGTAVAFTSSGANTLFGSYLLPSGTTNSNVGMTFEGRASGMPANGWQIQSGGVSFAGAVNISAFGGTYQLLDAFLSSSNFNLTNGTFDANDFNVTAATIVTTGTLTRAITMGSGTWTANSTGNAWNASTATNLTVTPEASTIVISNTTATAKLFLGGTKTYNNLTITGDDITISGNNTFNVLALNNPDEAEGLIIGTGSTQTVTNMTTTAASTDVVLLFGVAGGGTETLTKSGGGTICLDWMTITNLTGTPADTWYAGANSTDGTGNSGFTFTACPVAGGGTSPYRIVIPAEVKAVIPIEYRIIQ